MANSTAAVTTPSSLPPSAVTLPPSTIFSTAISVSTFTVPSSNAAVTSAVISITPVSTAAPTTQAPPAPAPSSPAAPEVITSVITQTPTAPGQPPTVIVITSTAPVAVAPPPVATSSRTTSATTSTTSGAAALDSPNAADQTNGISPGGKIAVAVVVPLVAVALIVFALLFLWRRRKQRKDAEELRRKEVEEYGFNPNNDPTLPVVGVAGSHGDEPSEMRETDGAGYRGWGTTTSARNPSTTMSNGLGPIGVARSDSGSNPGGYHAHSPTTATTTGHNSDVQSGDPLVGRPTSTGSETIGALGAAPIAMGSRADRGINRGPSNASSAYSGANRSEASGEGPPHAISSPPYYNDPTFYDEGMAQHGPYGDGSYGGGQPVIRDVQAKRNTRIENPSVIPHHGNAGIAQNF